jgi:hypothetical protein
MSAPAEAPAAAPAVEGETKLYKDEPTGEMVSKRWVVAAALRGSVSAARRGGEPVSIAEVTLLA